MGLYVHEMSSQFLPELRIEIREDLYRIVDTTDDSETRAEDVVEQYMLTILCDYFWLWQQ